LKVLNHVDLDKIQSSIETMKRDPVKAKKVTRVDGEWTCEGSQGPQFRADFETESGKFALETDSPGFPGGTGSRPGPLHYCIFGLRSCFAFTFMTLAAMEGISIKSARFLGECHLDFTKTFGLSDKPIMDNVKFRITADRGTNREALQTLVRLAEQRCPAVFSFANRINVETEVLTD
jgi:uncharacterized OsmC-like protein